MKRKLKFRAWDKNLNKYKYFNFLTCLPVYSYEKEFEIEQFTGLYDIKNKPIYENDILLNEDCGECYQVKWDDENACFYWDQDYFMGDNLNCMIVIGNINENSQILSKIS